MSEAEKLKKIKALLGTLENVHEIRIILEREAPKYE